jgi:hypothetical protein
MFGPVVEWDFGVLQFVGEGECGGQQGILREDVNAVGMLLEVIAEVDSSLCVSRRNLRLLCPLLAIDRIVCEFDDMEYYDEPGEQVRELRQMLFHGAVSLVSYFRLVLDQFLKSAWGSLSKVKKGT